MSDLKINKFLKKLFIILDVSIQFMPRTLKTIPLYVGIVRDKPYRSETKKIYRKISFPYTLLIRISTVLLGNFTSMDSIRRGQQI